MSHDSPRSVLIIHPGGLGDVLLSLPAIVSIRNRYPAHRILLMAESEVGHLLQACRVVDHVIPTEAGDLAGLFSGAQQISVSTRQWAERCDLAVGWLKDPDGAFRSTLEQLRVRQVVVESPTPRPGVHQSRRFFDTLEKLPGDRTWPAHLFVPDQFRETGADVLRAVGIQREQAVVLCHPGSGSRHKCIRSEIMAEIIQKVQQRKFTPVIVGGPADDDAVERLRHGGLHTLPVIQRQRLATLAGILTHARLFIGHDSGLTHLAALIQRPTVAIFGPTDPRQWAPQGAHVSVVTGRPCSCPNWEFVRACTEKSCLSVSPDDVVTAAFSVLGRYREVTKS